MVSCSLPPGLVLRFTGKQLHGARRCQPMSPLGFTYCCCFKIRKVLKSGVPSALSTLGHWPGGPRPEMLWPVPQPSSQRWRQEKVQPHGQGRCICQPMPCLLTLPRCDLPPRLLWEVPSLTLACETLVPPRPRALLPPPPPSSPGAAFH